MNQLGRSLTKGHASIAPCALPDSAYLIYVDNLGQKRSVELAAAGAVAFQDAHVVRKLPAYRRQRNFPGWWWAATTRSHVAYESWLERHHIIEADHDPVVTGIAGQPFALAWPTRRGWRHHVPDLFCRTFDGGGIVIDCRPVEKADDDFHEKCAITAAACDVIGWTFRAVGEPDPVWAANLRWLAGYRHPRFCDPRMESNVLEQCVTPQPLRQVAEELSDPIRVLPVLFHLLWRGRLRSDLSRPLSDTTLVTTSTDPLEER